MNLCGSQSLPFDSAVHLKFTPSLPRNLSRFLPVCSSEDTNVELSPGGFWSPSDRPGAKKLDKEL
jgi:hypothetical protein